MTARKSIVASLIVALLLPAPVMGAEDGRPIRAGVVSKVPAKKIAKATKKKAAKKKKRKPAKRKRTPPATEKPRTEAPPSDPPPEPVPPNIAFAAPLPWPWFLTRIIQNRVDLHRNLTLNATLWVHHGWEEIHVSYKLAHVQTLAQLAAQHGGNVTEVEPLCDDGSARAFTVWPPKGDVKRTAYREYQLEGRTVTLWFQGQWPAWNALRAEAEFDEIVCRGWIWRER